MLEEFDQNLPTELASVEEKMKELMEIEEATQLNEEFEKFKSDLIIEFTKELDYRDQTYVDSMKQFHKDIKKMIKLMSEQFINLRDKMLTELNLIEDKFNEDRKDIIDKRYTNYIKSLIDSIHYKTGNNLLPTFDYDSNNFVFGEQFAKNIREFNQNAVKETEYANIMDKGEYESYERGQFSNVYEDLTFDVNNERYYDSEKYFNPHNKMLQQGGYLNKEEAFAKAKLYAQTCFNEEYRKSIKKGLNKKYGVELK